MKRTSPMLRFKTHCSRRFTSTLVESETDGVVPLVRRERQEVKKQLIRPGKGSGKAEENFRKNDLNIQMLSGPLYKKLFGNARPRPIKPDIVNDLRRFNLPGPLHTFPDVDLNLPDLLGGDIEAHFNELGRQQSEPYKTLVDGLAMKELPPMPTEWTFVPGWTKYAADGKATPVAFPDEAAIVFDVEICMREGDAPTLATAASSDAWYSWVSRDLCKSNKRVPNSKLVTKDLIPLETGPEIKGRGLGDSFLKAKMAVGHSVSFDRACVKEQYWLDKTGTRFLDTMALHISISGVTSYQKSILKCEEDDELAALTSLNSLAAVYKLYYGEELGKEERNVFVSGGLADIREDFQNLTAYCAKDVECTHKILKKLWPLFLARFPHPVTLAGMLELGCCYLPVNKNWNRYVENCEQAYEEMHSEMNLFLCQRADTACQLMHGDRFKNHLWLWDQDWASKGVKLKKKKTKSKAEIPTTIPKEEEVAAEDDEDEIEYEKLRRKFAGVTSTAERLPAKLPHLLGYPEWYRKLCQNPKDNDETWTPGPRLISTSKRLAPKLLSLTWNGFPVHHIGGQGWCHAVPYPTTIELQSEEEIRKFPGEEFRRYFSRIPLEKLREMCGRDLDDGGIRLGFAKLPHKDGDDLNVGNPLAKDFVMQFGEMGLGGEEDGTRGIIDTSRKLSYWKNNRKRVKGQMVVYLDRKELPGKWDGDAEFGAILPKVVVCGTLTRRACEPTWMTASNAVDERVGSELRAMIQAPPGYHFVGADVDSQELWIASLIGDAYRGGEHGGTPFSWMVLSGQKADGTDMHSVTAKTAGISRQHAKVLNYARIYGAGERFAQRLLKQFVPGIEGAEARKKASDMFKATKGKRLFRLRDDCMPDQPQRLLSRFQARELCSAYGKSVEELFHPETWVGGSESDMFNSLEAIANGRQPKTPFLKGRLSRALEPRGDQSYYSTAPTRVNWVVQSGAVDFLHLMLVCMRWLVGPRVRFCLSFHDEVRYIVPDKGRYEAALALHATNLLVRAFCVRRMGMTDLPQSVAFFSAVDVDTVLRKETSQDCRTPSNPHGLTNGYGIPLGESLDIVAAIAKARGVVGVHKAKKEKRPKGECVSVTFVK